MSELYGKNGIKFLASAQDMTTIRLLTFKKTEYI